MEKKSENVLIITFWSFKDALVQTYTLPYVNIIRRKIPRDTKIFIVTFEQQRVALSAPELDQQNKEFAKENIQLVAFPYKKFGLKKLISAVGHLFSMIRLIKSKRIKRIHAFGPNAGSFGYLLSKMTGKELIIDSFEPHAEAMVENGTWKHNRGAHLILSKFERWQAKRAKHLIATSSGMFEYSIKTYGFKPESFFVKPACVDTNLFFPRKKDETLLRAMGLENKIICVYAGKLGGIYLNDEVFDFFKVCYDHWGESFRCVMVTNASGNEINKQLARVGIPSEIIISKFVFHTEVPKYLSLGDFAINPVKPVPTKRYCTSIKDGEYWAMGLPVVITPNISDDSDIIMKNNIGVILTGFDQAHYKKAVEDIDKIFTQNKTELQQKINEIAKKYRSYKIADDIYTEIYKSN
ncbi:MAG TPA: glycosyltransferase [Chitinophagaceae bacterium]|nr:glycosyltransferase [Chitinophagaceae bacterium]